MDAEAFAAAVRKTGRSKLIIAVNDVVTVYPALTALRMVYEVQVVADAGGSAARTADDFALRRMRRAGAVITFTSQVLAELVPSRTRTGERGGMIIPIGRGAHDTAVTKRT